MIKVLTLAPTGGGWGILFSKLDIKEGFWRIVHADGKEFNFAYVLPNHQVNLIEVAVLLVLQMGWTYSPSFFCAASKTIQDVTATYMAKPVSS